MQLTPQKVLTRQCTFRSKASTNGLPSDLALRMAQTRPDLFYAYVGSGQLADETKNWSVAYVALLEKAQATRNQQAIDELRRVGPPPYANGEG